MEPELRCDQCGRPISVRPARQVGRSEKFKPGEKAAKATHENKSKLSSEKLAQALWRVGKAELLIDDVCADTLFELGKRKMIAAGSECPRLTKLGQVHFKRLQAGREVPGLDPRTSLTPDL